MPYSVYSYGEVLFSLEVQLMATLTLWLLLVPIAMGAFGLIWWGIAPSRLTDSEDMHSFLEWLRGNDA